MVFQPPFHNKSGGDSASLRPWLGKHLLFLICPARANRRLHSPYHWQSKTTWTFSGNRDGVVVNGHLAQDSASTVTIVASYQLESKLLVGEEHFLAASTSGATALRLIYSVSVCHYKCQL